MEKLELRSFANKSLSESLAIINVETFSLETQNSQFRNNQEELELFGVELVFRHCFLEGI